MLHRPLPNLSEFDLTEASAYWYRFNLPGRVLILAIGNGFFLLWLLLIGRLATRIQVALASGAWGDLAIQLGYLSLGPAIFLFGNYVALVSMARGPSRLEVNSAGLEFSYDDGKRRRLRWDDPELDLLFRDDRTNSHINRLIAIDVKLPGRGLVPIPEEALEFITAEACKRGLVVDERSGGRKVDRFRGTKVIRIRPPNRGPSGRAATTSAV